MFLTRIQRGATRTNILLRIKAERLRVAYREVDILRPRQKVISGSGFRTFAFCVAAAYTAVMPVLPLRAQAAAPHQGASSEDLGEPPSIQSGLPAMSIVAVRVESQITSSLVVDTDQLASVSVGDSLDTVQQKEAAAEQAALLQQQQEEAEQRAQALLAQERAAAQAAAAALAAASADKTDVQSALHDLTAATFGEDQWPAMYALVEEESGFSLTSYNTRSGACGLFQALPCSKMGGTDMNTQLNWGIGYIKNRYGTPSAALAFHNVSGYY